MLNNIILINAHDIVLFTETGYRFSESHEWVSVADNKATIGITHYAQVSMPYHCISCVHVSL